MADVPPMSFDPRGCRMPRLTADLRDRIALALAGSVEKWVDELGKHGVVLSEIPECWETCATVAYVVIAKEAGATVRNLPDLPNAND